MNSLERSVIFADLSGFTAMTETHGDVDAVAIAFRFKALAEAALVHSAHIVKTIGDAVMIVAPDPVAAAQVVMRLAQSVHSEPYFPIVRIGMHHGPVIESNGDYFGAAVNLAARVARHARAGQVLCTSNVADILRTELGLELLDAGLAHLKNISVPVQLFELCLAAGQREANIDPVCRMQVTDVNAASRIVHDAVPYYFCSAQCVEIFLNSPEKYVFHK